MNKTFSKIFGVLACVLLALLLAFAFTVPNAQSQGWSYRAPVLSSVTVNAASTSNYNVSLPVVNSTLIGLQARWKSSGDSISNVVFIIDTSMDGAYWMSNQFRFQGPNIGSNQYSCIVTSINLGGVAFARLGSVYNLNSNSITGLTFIYGTKDGM